MVYLRVALAGLAATIAFVRAASTPKTREQVILLVPEPFASFVQTLLTLLRENDLKALFLLLLVEEAGVPLPAPGDLVIMYAGMRAAMGEMSILESAVVVTVAVQLGSTILYTISRKFGHTILFRYGRLIHLDSAKLEKVEGWIQKRGAVMVLVGRLTPGLRTPTSIMAGAFEVPFHRFLLFATVAAVAWSGFWLTAGYLFGKQLAPLVKYSHYSAYILLAAAVAFVAWHVVRLQQERRRRSLAPE